MGGGALGGLQTPPKPLRHSTDMVTFLPQVVLNNLSKTNPVLHKEENVSDDGLTLAHGDEFKVRFPVVAEFIMVGLGVGSSIFYGVATRIY